jgi:hypothetical protein
VKGKHTAKPAESYIKLGLNVAVGAMPRDIKMQQCIAWISDYAKRSSDRMPTTDGTTRLPDPFITHVWAWYNRFCRRTPHTHEKVSYNHFKTAFHKVQGIALARKTGTLAKCSKCNDFDKELKRCPLHDWAGREEVYMKYRGHLILQQLERLSYYKRKDFAAKYPKVFLSCIVDATTQADTKVPHLEKTIKESQRMQHVPQGIMGVHFYGRATYMVPCDPYLPGGSARTCQIFSQSLEKLAKEDQLYKEMGLPRTLFLQLDNCWSDNKNRTFLGHLASLVTDSTFDEVITCFLVQGHTHEDIDQLFSIISNYLKGKSFLTREEYDAAIRDALHRFPNVHVFRLHTVADWKSWCDLALDKNLAGHSGPHCYVLSADSVGSMRTCVLRYRSFWTSETWYPRVQVTKEVLEGVYKETTKTVYAMDMDDVHSEAERYEGSIIGAPVRPLATSFETPGCEKKSDAPCDNAVSSDGAVAGEALLERDATQVPQLHESVFWGRDWLTGESGVSCASFYASPGINIMQTKPNFVSLAVSPPAEFKDLDAIKKDVYRLLHLPSVQCERAGDIEEVIWIWDEYFASIPTTLADAQKLGGWEIDWDFLRRGKVNRLRGVREDKVSELITLTHQLDYAGNGPVCFTGDRHDASQRRQLTELQEAARKVPIKIGDFVILQRTNDVLEGDGFTPEEESLPFTAGKAMSAWSVDSPGNDEVLIHWWRQPRGDPNLSFIKGVDGKSKNWTSHVPRDSVLLVNPSITWAKRHASFKLLTLSKKQLVELHHPSLRGWVVVPTYGLVYCDPSDTVGEASVGDYLLVSTRAAPPAVTKFLDGDQRTTPFLLVRVEQVDVNRSRLYVQWFRAFNNDVNDRFVPVISSSSIRLTEESKENADQ